MNWNLAATIAALWLPTSILLGMAVGRFIRHANERDEAFWRSIHAGTSATRAFGRAGVPALALTAAR